MLRPVAGATVTCGVGGGDAGLLHAAARNATTTVPRTARAVMVCGDVRSCGAMLGIRYLVHAAGGTVAGGVLQGASEIDQKRNVRPAATVTSLRVFESPPSNGLKRDT